MDLKQSIVPALPGFGVNQDWGCPWDVDSNPTDGPDLGKPTVSDWRVDNIWAKANQGSSQVISLVTGFVLLWLTLQSGFRNGIALSGSPRAKLF